jgi:hypothetical protein
MLIFDLGNKGDVYGALTFFLVTDPRYRLLFFARYFC